MAVQLSVDVRNGRLDSIETVIGASPLLAFRTGAPPVNCAAANSGSLLENMPLPADYFAAAVSGAKAKTGTWTGSADAGGVVGHFRMMNNGDTVCHMQGTVTGSGGGGDMEVDNVNIANGQTITVNTFTMTDGNA